MLGSQDLIVGLVIVLVLFGAKKLPELAGSIGKSMKEFKKGVSDTADEEPGKAVGPSTTPASATKYASCETPLDPSWQHCPRCGTASAVDSLMTASTGAVRGPARAPVGPGRRVDPGG
jgi:sec-independent protein translocase protein TatA